MVSRILRIFCSGGAAVFLWCPSPYKSSVMAARAPSSGLLLLCLPPMGPGFPPGSHGAWIPPQLLPQVLVRQAFPVYAKKGEKDFKANRKILAITLRSGEAKLVNPPLSWQK